MRTEEFVGILQESPIVAAVKDEKGLAQCLKSECRIVFVLYGDIMNIADTTSSIKNAGKLAMVHIDLIGGLAAREVAVDFIARSTCAGGILSTKPNLVRHAKSLGLLTVQRFFMLDSIALDSVTRQLPLDAADVIEILPGVMPKIIRGIAAATNKPIIAGGLITDKEDVMNALGAGAVAVSSTNPEVWFL